jgi:ABC-2 type transport system permease protein
MTSFRHAARVVRYTALVGIQDRLAVLTWQTWVFGYLLRMITQVLFFALIGLLLGSTEAMHYLFIGNVAAIGALTSLGAAPDTADERYQGTLPLQVAAPSSLLLVYSGRSLLHMTEALVISMSSLVALAPIIDYPYTITMLYAVPFLATIVIATYGFAIFLTAIVIRWVHWGNTVFNLVFWTMAAITGVNVRVEFFPGWVQAIANALPLTHGLAAVRLVLADGFAADAFRLAGVELLVGLAWFAAALFGFKVFVEGARRDGSIDLTE